MADSRKVPFVTLASYTTAGNPIPECKKQQQQQQQQQQQPQQQQQRRREEDGEGGAHLHHGRDGALGTGPGLSSATAAPTATGGGLISNGKSSGAEGAAGTGESKPTVRLSLCLSEPSDKTFTEFNYSELLQSSQQVKKPPDGLKPVLDPNDPLADKERERQEVEALARKFESKYGGAAKKKKRDRMQDLIDIGYGYDETDPFIDNSEAYDELVPASLTTKLGGFYINTGTLQFRPASESEDEDTSKDGNHFKKLKDGEERVIKRRKKKQDGTLEEKKPRKNRVPKPGVSALNRPEKKKRKKLMKDSLSLAAMIRRFTREKEELRKKNPATAAAAATATTTCAPGFKPPNPNRPLNAHSVASSNDLTDLTNDPSVMPLLAAANDDILQDLMKELDFTQLDPSETLSLEGQSENGSAAHRAGPSVGRVPRMSLIPSPPPLPAGLPAPLTKRIDDLRAASQQFDMEGRKKFFTLDMNNILLDIELQVQEQPTEVRVAVYSHLEAFVPCNKEALLKRLKKLSLNVQDDRLRNPLLKLKLAVCSAMPEQIARYNMNCLAKVAKQQSEEGEKNGSEEEDDERPGKRVMGPRKKFVWDDKLRTLLCNLVRAKLGCYEAEGQNSSSPEDYLKAFMETEVKPLWPKGWMQARMLMKESRVAHGHLTGNTVKKRMVPTPKAKPKAQDGVWLQQSTLPSATPSAPLPQCPSSPSDLICLSDSLDEDLGGAPSMDSISQALALLSSAAKGLIQPDGPSSPERPKPVGLVSSIGLVSSVSSASPQLIKKNTNATPSQAAVGTLIVSSSNPTSSSQSPAISRPASVSVSPSVRTEGLTGVKAAAVSLAQVQRHAITQQQQRPICTASGVVKPSVTSSPKPRPPPTASPLHPPIKGFNSPLVISTGLHKPSNNSSVGRIGAVATTLSSQPHSTTLPISASSFSASPSPSSSCTPSPSSSHLNAKPQPKSSPPSPAPPKPQQHHPQPQSTFVTPMQATLTKSPHSTSSSILKLTPRVAPTSSPSPALSRTPSIPSMHQYAAKSPAFHAGFSGVGASYSTPVGQQKNSSQVNSAGLTSTSSSIVKHQSPVAGAVNHGQRQRSVGVANQGAKPMVSVSSTSAPQLAQVSSAGGTLLAAGAANLPLSFGMLSGITPLPFSFPSLMSLPTVTGTSAGANTANQSSSGYTLQPNLLKGLMSGAALPPHLQLAFPDVSQSQSGDVKRKL